MTKIQPGKKTVLSMWLDSCTIYFALCAISFATAAGNDFGRNSPMQMDILASKDITICTGLKRAIACRDGSNIAITHAFWGRVSDKVCPSDDGDPVTDCEGAEETIDLVRARCEGKSECVLQARHQYLQKNNTHHCPGVNKYLVVNYTCIPDSKGIVLCDSEEATLECRAGWKIDISDAFWGTRANSKYCSTGVQGMECDNGPFAKTYLKKKCDGSTTCIVRATSDDLEDKKSVCPGNLLYLLLNYACKSPNIGNAGSKSPDTDDENETAVENKLLADTSSKELMGLLEKHLNELQTKPTFHDKDDSSKSDDDKVKDTKALIKKASASSTAAAKKPAKKQASKAEQQAAVNSDLALQAPSSTAGYVRSLSNTGADKETPAMDIKETDASKKSQETVPAAATVEKKQVLPKASMEVTNEEPTYEVTEPSAMKSILARAKEVLKSLDEEKEESNSTVATDSQKAEKKSDISRKDKQEDTADDTKTVKQVAKLAANLVKTANKLKNHRIKNGTQNATPQQIQPAPQSVNATSTSSQLRNLKKPKPGPKKSGLSATGPGRAGVGNTP